MRVKHVMLLVAVLAAAGCIGTSPASAPAGGGVAVGNAVGNRAPDFAVTTVDGTTVRLSDLRGRPVVLEFFATWCPHCYNDFSAVKDVYPQYKNNVTYLLVDLDLKEGKDIIARYRDRNGFVGTFATGNAAILRDYAVTYTTTKYLISKDGIILRASSGEIDAGTWKRAFEALAGN